MKVVLPDNSELELPDRATGLDAARAIGPKLAEQAVLVKANGEPRDLRLPVSAGERIRFLTTRDTDDPDALYVLRHSSAHLLAEAVRRFEAEGEPYKVELVSTAQGDISLYTQGDFTDLCRGPHLQNAKPIKAFKLTSLAGAYWRGDEHNTQLTRIYGTAFYSKVDLDAYLERLEDARRRDHRKLGPQLDLFHFDEVSPGSAL